MCVYIYIYMIHTNIHILYNYYATSGRAPEGTWQEWEEGGERMATMSASKRRNSALWRKWANHPNWCTLGSATHLTDDKPDSQAKNTSQEDLLAAARYEAARQRSRRVQRSTGALARPYLGLEPRTKDGTYWGALLV